MGQIERSPAQIAADARFAKWMTSFQEADRKEGAEKVKQQQLTEDDDEAMEGEIFDDECPMCRGTGEGAFDGQSCLSCKGRGHLGGLKY